MDFLNKVIKKNKDLAWRIIDGEAVVIALGDQPEGGESINIFNETATRTWELIDGKMTAIEIIKQIIEEYAVETQEAESQVKKLIHDMLCKKLIAI